MSKSNKPPFIVDNLKRAEFTQLQQLCEGPAWMAVLTLLTGLSRKSRDALEHADDEQERGKLKLIRELQNLRDTLSDSEPPPAE